jgi:hypothetical protein
MILLVLFLLPIWAVLLLDSGLKLLLLGGRLWEKPRAKKPKELLVPPHWASIGIVIPAHNEDAIIGETARLLTQLSYPSSRFTVVVLADGCTDQTASRAREQGARCIERAAQAEQGKGRALSWLLMEHAETLRDFDIVLICDADSRLHPDALSFINQAFANGCQVIQTTVEREAKASPIGAAVALPEALSQEIDDLYRSEEQAWRFDASSSCKWAVPCALERKISNCPCDSPRPACASPRFLGRLFMIRSRSRLWARRVSARAGCKVTGKLCAGIGVTRSRCSVRAIGETALYWSHCCVVRARS